MYEENSSQSKQKVNSVWQASPSTLLQSAQYLVIPRTDWCNWVCGDPHQHWHLERCKVNRNGTETWLLHCGPSFIIQMGLSEGEHHSRRCTAEWRGACGHLWMGRESLGELDLEPEAIACLNYLSYIWTPHWGFHGELSQPGLKRSVSSHPYRNDKHDWIMQWNSVVSPMYFWQHIYFLWSL